MLLFNGHSESAVSPSQVRMRGHFRHTFQAANSHHALSFSFEPGFIQNSKTTPRLPMTLFMTVYLYVMTV